MKNLFILHIYAFIVVSNHFFWQKQYFKNYIQLFYGIKCYFVSTLKRSFFSFSIFFSKMRKNYGNDNENFKIYCRRNFTRYQIIILYKQQKLQINLTTLRFSIVATIVCIFRIMKIVTTSRIIKSLGDLVIKYENISNFISLYINSI